MAYNDIDLSIYGEYSALRSELETVKHFLQNSVLELSRKKWVELSHEKVINKLDFVYNDLPSTAEINISFGFVLQSVHNSNEFQDYYAADDKQYSCIPLFSLMTQISALSNRNWEVKIFYSILLISVQTLNWSFIVLKISLSLYFSLVVFRLDAFNNLFRQPLSGIP